MLGPSNDCQNLSFVKATNVVGKKMAGNTCKMAMSYLCHFRFETEFSIFIKISFFIFSGLREKQDKVDFGNDREDNIIEDLNTLSDKIKSNVNSLNQ